jgi:methyltransferase, FkbM family
MRLLRLLRYVWMHPLNARGKFSALVRIVKWQLGNHLLPGMVALPFVEDTFLFAKRGMTGATGNWYCGLHEVNEMAFVLHLLRRDEHFADIGANIGSYTILAAGAAGARVHSAEPIPETFRHLQHNVLLNDLAERVRISRIGISDRVSVLRFSSGLDCVNHVLAPGEDLPGVEVPVTTLDEWVGGEVPTLIKIDVEGHELAVLQGGEKTLADPRLLAVIMEINGSGERYGIADTQLVDIMLGHGFSAFGYDPFGRRLVDPDSSNGNTIFVRDRAAVEARVASARHYRLVNGTI